jgi:hypothetical protein
MGLDIFIFSLLLVHGLYNRDDITEQHCSSFRPCAYVTEQEFPKSLMLCGVGLLDGEKVRAVG